MIGYVKSAKGAWVALPPLIQWRLLYTDGDPCDGFSLRFCLEDGAAEALSTATEFLAEAGGRTVFTGVVDDYELCMDEKGLLAELTGRGPAARLLDNQVRAAEYQLAQYQDIVSTYVRPYGIGQIDAQSFPPVERFVVETGYSCWQVLTGFCRHSAEVFPRFSKDGTLILRKPAPGKTLFIGVEQCEQIRVLNSRFGRISKQILINTRKGTQQVYEDRAFQAKGGQCVKVSGFTGDKTRAVWRNARQRVEDAARDKELIELTLPGGFLAKPLDRVTLTADALGISGSYWVSSAQTLCDETGLRCTLTLRE